MKSLELIIKESLKNEINDIQSNNSKKLNEFRLTLSEIAADYIVSEQIGFNKPINKGPVQFKPDWLLLNPATAAANDKAYKAAEQVQTKYNAINFNLPGQDPNTQKQLRSYIKPKDKWKKVSDPNKQYWKQWNNTAADSYFYNISKLDTNNPVRSGMYKNMSNPDYQFYDYQILGTDSKGKSIAAFRFKPDGTVNIYPDLYSTAKAFTYKISGGKVYIYSVKDDDQWVLVGTPIDYALSFSFNKVFSDPEAIKKLDPYKGAGFLRSLFLDVAGYKRKQQDLWKSQKEYERSAESAKDTIQTILDWLGLIPGYGDVIDILNAIWYFSRGKRFEGYLSLIAIVPLVGSVLKLSIKTTFKAIKVGSKSGVEAIELVLKSPKEFKQLFIEALAKNKEARQAVLKFIQNTPNAIKNAKSILKAALIKIKSTFGNTWVATALEAMIKKYGDDFFAYCTNTAKDLNKMLDQADAAADLLVVSGKTEVKLTGDAVEASAKAANVSTKTVRNLAGSLGSNPDFAGRVLYKILGRRFYDALAQSMADSFINYVKKGGVPSFIAALRTTPDGAKIISEGLRKFPKIRNTIVEYVTTRPRLIEEFFGAQSALSRYSGKTLNQLTASDVAFVYNKLLSKFDEFVTGGAGLEKYLKKVILAPLASNAELYSSLVKDIVVTCIERGNLMFKMWSMNFWNTFKSYAPWALHKYYDAKNILVIKYDFSRGKLFDLSSPVGKWIMSGENNIIKGVKGLLGGPLAGISWMAEQLSNLKRLDIIYNELSDFIEKIGMDADNADEKQGVIVSILAYILGEAPFKVVGESLKFTKDVTRPDKHGFVANPSDYEFVKQEKFNTTVK